MINLKQTTFIDVLRDILEKNRIIISYIITIHNISFKRWIKIFFLSTKNTNILEDLIIFFLLSFSVKVCRICFISLFLVLYRVFKLLYSRVRCFLFFASITRTAQMNVSYFYDKIVHIFYKTLFYFSMKFHHIRFYFFHLSTLLCCLSQVLSAFLIIFKHIIQKISHLQ